MILCFVLLAFMKKGIFNWKIQLLFQLYIHFTLVTFTLVTFTGSVNKASFHTEQNHDGTVYRGSTVVNSLISPCTKPEVEVNWVCPVRSSTQTRLSGCADVGFAVTNNTLIVNNIQQSNEIQAIAEHPGLVGNQKERTFYFNVLVQGMYICTLIFNNA